MPTRTVISINRQTPSLGPAGFYPWVIIERLLMIHYKFVGVIEIPDDRDNYTADTRKGVAVEYVTKSS